MDSSPHAHSRFLAVLACAALLGAALAPSGTASASAPSAPAAAAPAATTRATSASPDADARGAGRWTRVSTGDVGLLDVPALLRTGDGVLHAVYSQDVGTQQAYEHTAITAAGEVGAHHPVTAPWGSLLRDPQLLAAPGGMRLVFSGLQDTNTGNFFSAGRMYHALSDTSGAAWNIPAEALTKSASAYGSYGTAAVNLADGTPLVAFVLNSAVVLRAGTIPAAAFDPTLPDTVAPDVVTGQSRCCGYQTSLARTGDAVFAAWYGNGDTGDSEGVLVRQVWPGVGALAVAPGSNSPTGSLFNSYAPDQQVPMVTRPDGSVVVAYCQGSYACDRLVLWQVGTGTVVTVPGAKGATHVDMAVGPDGRLWLAYLRSGRVWSVRTSPTGYRFGATQDHGAPGGSSSLYRIQVDSTAGFADLVVNDGAQLAHLRVRPALELRATPRAWSSRRARTVRFKVTEAGAAVAGAIVRGGGKSCRTNGSGVCRITYAPRRPGKFKVKATRSGYAPGTVRLKARRR